MKRRSDVVRFDSVMKEMAPPDDNAVEWQRFRESCQELLREKDELKKGYLRRIAQIKRELEVLSRKMPRGVPRKVVKILRSRPPHALNRGDLTIRLKKILARGRNTIPGIIEELTRDGYVFAEGRNPKKIVRGSLSSKSWCRHSGKYYRLAAVEAKKLKAAA